MFNGHSAILFFPGVVCIFVISGCLIFPVTIHADPPHPLFVEAEHGVAINFGGVEQGAVHGWSRRENPACHAINFSRWHRWMNAIGDFLGRNRWQWCGKTASEVTPLASGRNIFIDVFRYGRWL